MNDTTSLTIVRAVPCVSGLVLKLKPKPRRVYYSELAQSNFNPAIWLLSAYVNPVAQCLDDHANVFENQSRIRGCNHTLSNK